MMCIRIDDFIEILMNEWVPRNSLLRHAHGNIGLSYQKTPRCPEMAPVLLPARSFSSPHTYHSCFTYFTMAAQLYKTASGRLFHAGAVAIITVG